MNQAIKPFISTDPIWDAVRDEARVASAGEPALARFLQNTILGHSSLEDALSFTLADKLHSTALPGLVLRELLDAAMVADPAIGVAVRADLEAIRDRDPACERFTMPLLYFKGFHALQSYRIAHYLWRHRRRELALYLQSRISMVFGVDIHPAAIIGSAILIDHATGVVIGETSVIGDNVSLLHGVTLGGTGKESGDRHPKIRSGVLIGAAATILGNVTIGKNAQVGAGSVVLHDVPARCTVAGVPAVPVGGPCKGQPARNMDHRLNDATE